MPTFTVRFSALTDLVANVDVKARTPAEAIAKAKATIDEWRCGSFELPDNGIEPIPGTEEVFAVDDEDGDEIGGIESEQTDYSTIADMMAEAKKRARIISDWTVIDA